MTAKEKAEAIIWELSQLLDWSIQHSDIQRRMVKASALFYAHGRMSEASLSGMENSRINFWSDVVTEIEKL